MALRLKNVYSNSEVILDTIEFLTAEDLRYFRVRNKNDVGINVEYIPLTDCDWDKDRFEMYIFENPYLNAENDVFEIYESTIAERLGWIFPITILESNDNDFSNTKNLNKYKCIAYKKLLEQPVTIIQKEQSTEFYKLSEIFSNSIICLLSKDTTSKIDGFNFKKYLLSFYDYGYLLLGNSHKAKSVYDKSEFLKIMRTERKRVTLKKANFEIHKNSFTNALFLTEHLLQSDNFVVRFILLYQILEDFMAHEFDKQFASYLDAYNNNLLVKNDLKENIMAISKERTLIKDVLNRINIDNVIQELFLKQCQYLFDDINFKSKRESLPDKIYDLRNILIHRLRELTDKTEYIQRILEIFERVVIEILINYTEADTITSD